MLEEKVKQLTSAYENIFLVNELLIASYIAFFQVITDLGLEEFKKCSLFGSNKSKE